MDNENEFTKRFVDDIKKAINDQLDSNSDEQELDEFINKITANVNSDTKKTVELIKNIEVIKRKQKI